MQIPQFEDVEAALLVARGEYLVVGRLVHATQGMIAPLHRFPCFQSNQIRLLKVHSSLWAHLTASFVVVSQEERQEREGVCKCAGKYIQT